MSNGFTSKRRVQPKTPAFKVKTSPNAFELLIARDILGRKEEQREPQLAAEIQTAKERARLVPERQVLASNLVRMKQLFDQAPRPEPGIIQRGIGYLQNIISQKGQTLPQIDQYEDFKKTFAGSLAKVIGGETGARLSDFDIERVVGSIPDIVGDTKDRGLLGWRNLFDTIDDVLESYGSKRQNYSSILFNPSEKGRSFALQGNLNFQDLPDEELLGAASDDVTPFNTITKEALLKELER